MRVSLFHLLALGMVTCAHVAADEPRPIPACMVIDDPAPFLNMRWVKDKSVCREIPTSFYQELGRWAKRLGVKGKFSVIPCLGGIKPIDGSLGEYPGTAGTNGFNGSRWSRPFSRLASPLPRR